jgi:cytochrome c oxidase subunit II
LWVCGVMFTIVFVFGVVAILRGRSKRHSQDDAQQHRKFTIALVVWSTLVVLGLFALTMTSFFTDRALVRAAAEPNVIIKVTGYQWWWDVEYLSSDPSQQFRTANEIHVPVDAQVLLQLNSNDVIHSFWVPNLHGKRDLIPGRPNEVTLQPRQRGIFRGECAEFCGVQHAHMALDFVVELQEDFERWRQQQLASAPPPGDAKTQEGLSVFMDSACSMCHAITGTPAFGQVGPDLTHLASRRMIAAGTLANTPENMRRWIVNPHDPKPGNHMPAVSLQDHQLDALVAYLGTLK